MKKDLLILCAVALIVVFVASGTKIQSPSDYYLTHLDDVKADSETVFLSVECGTILDNWNDLDPALKYEKYVPQNGVLLGLTDESGKLTGGIEYVLRPGDTVFAVLLRAARHDKLPLVYQGAQFNAYNSIYVQGINHLFEFSCGPLSGWMYSVNGVFPDKGCSVYELKDGDVIEWRYTCDLGRDVGGYMGNTGNN
jgi:hypothetical protein